MSLIDVLNKAKDAVWEGDEKPEDKVLVVSKPRPANPSAPVVSFTGNSFRAPSTDARVAMTSSTYTPAVAQSATLSDSNVFLANLKDKTDFDKTAIGAQVREHLIPLDGLPLNETQKMTAVLKAGAREGLTPEKIIGQFQSFLSVIEKEKSGFDGAVADATAKEIDGRQTAIKDEVDHASELEQRLATSRQRQADLSSELVTAQAKIRDTQTQFKNAYEQRVSEINAQIAHYTEVTKGI
jgi:hypothetical protein